MTVAPSSSNHQQSSRGSSSHYQKTVRRGSLQETMRTSTGCTLPRRSSLSAMMLKTRFSSQQSLIVAAETHQDTPTAACSSASDGFLQSADNRRRYMRRGSKTSFMMKNSGLPLEWQTTLAKAITKRVVSSSSSTFEDDCSTTHSQGSLTTASFSSTHSTTMSSLPSPPLVMSEAKDPLDSPPATLKAAQHGAAAQLEMLRRSSKHNQSRFSSPLSFDDESNSGMERDGETSTFSSSRNKKHSNVSLLTSALERLSSIENQSKKHMQEN